jgi:hypothetical protein
LRVLGQLLDSILQDVSDYLCMTMTTCNKILRKSTLAAPATSCKALFAFL